MTAQRYARHALIPGWDQDRLAAAHVVVVGVGALGGEVARLLAMAGVGRLTLVDPDTVALSNLSRCVLFRTADVGRSKVAAAADRLREIAPDVVVEPRATPLASGAGLAELRDASLVVSAVDSVAARIGLAARCTSAGVGMLDAGTRAWGGEVRHFPAGGACYACPLTPAERAVQDDPWGCGQLASPVDAGASGAVSALVGSWQSALALRLLFGLEAPALTRVDVVAGAWPGPGPERAPDCPCHEPIAPETVSVVPVGTTATVSETLAWVDPEEDVMTWVGFDAGLDLPTVAGGLTTFLRRAPAQRTLRELGVAPGEILPVPSASGGVRFIELSSTSEERSA